MMERLTEWKDDRKLLAKTKFSGDFGSANVLGRLAEYEDLEEQGLLLRLPCKVGTEVWTIMCGMTGKHPILFKQYFELSMLQYWGKAVFLTKEEAEQKLKGMESD